MIKHRSIFIAAWGLTFGLSVYALARSSDIRFGARGLPAVATLGKAVGKVQARGEDALGWARVESGDELHDGDSIATGEASQARLRFPDGRVLELGAGTLLEVRAQNNGAGGEYLVSLLKGLVVSNSEEQKPAAAAAAPARLRIVSGTREYQLDDRKTDLALEAKSRSKEAAVLFASKEIAVRDLTAAPSAPAATLAPVAKVASLAAIRMAPAAPVQAPLPVLRTDAKLSVVDPKAGVVRVAAPETAEAAPPPTTLAPAPPPTTLAPAPQDGDDEDDEGEEPAPTPIAVAKPARVLFPAAGSTFWILKPSARIPVRIEPVLTPSIVEITRAGGGRGKKLAFAANHAEAAFTAADVLPKGVGAPLRAGTVAFTVKSLDEFAGAVTVDLDDLVEQPSNGRDYIVERRLKSSPPAHQLRLAHGKELPRAAPLLEGASGFRIVKAVGLAETGTFLVREGEVVAEVTPADAAVWCKRLGCDLAFRGRRAAVATAAQVEAAMQGKKKTYLVMKDALVPLNWSFFQQFSEVRAYVTKKSPVVFTEPVDLVPTK